MRKWLCLPNLLDEGLEGFWVLDGHLRKDLAIEGNALLRFEGDESAVFDTVEAERRVKTGDPESAERAFLGSAITMGVLAGLDDRFFGFGK